MDVDYIFKRVWLRPLDMSTPETASEQARGKRWVNGSIGQPAYGGVMSTEAEVEHARINARNDLRIANNETKRLKHQAAVIAIAKAKAEALTETKLMKLNVLTAAMLFAEVAKRTLGTVACAAIQAGALAEFGPQAVRFADSLSHFISALVNAAEGGPQGGGQKNFTQRSLVHYYRAIGGTMPVRQLLKAMNETLGHLLSCTLSTKSKNKTIYHLDLSLARAHIGETYDPKARFARDFPFVLHVSTTLNEKDAKAKTWMENEARAKPKPKPKQKPKTKHFIFSA